MKNFLRKLKVENYQVNTSSKLILLREPLLHSKHFYNQKTKMVNKHIKFYQLNLYDTSTKRLPENLKSWIIPDIIIYKHLVTSHWRGQKHNIRNPKSTNTCELSASCLPTHEITAEQPNMIRYTTELTT